MPDYKLAARRVAQKYGVDPAIFTALVQQESGFQPQVSSGAGAIGLTQLMPGTAASLGVNPRDPIQNLEGGAKYLRQQLDRFGNYGDALRAYNAGPGAVQQSHNYAETNAYVKRILGAARKTPSVSAPSGSPSSVPTSQTVTTPGVDNSQARRQALAQFLLGGTTVNPTTGQTSYGGDILQFALAMRQMGDTPGTTQTVQTGTSPGTDSQASSAPVGKAKAGNPVVGGTSIGGIHPTLGLGGYPARDYFAPSGATVVAPVSGKITRLSGHDPAGGPTQGPHGPLGWSVYIQGDDGHSYFLTHMGSRTVHPGQRVKAGQRIGTVADYHKYGTADHIHMGVH